jgi:hypothetical protein
MLTVIFKKCHDIVKNDLNITDKRIFPRKTLIFQCLFLLSFPYWTSKIALNAFMLLDLS